MHKAPLTALAAGLTDALAAYDIDADVRILDMQAGRRERTPYGALRLGRLCLQKFRVGMPFEEASPRLARSHIIGINSNFTHSRRIVSDLVRHARRVNRNAAIVVGGADATACPEYYLRRGADVVVRGEGELSFATLIATLRRNDSLESVPNISYLKAGALRHTPQTFLSRDGSYDVDRLPPPALHLVDVSGYDDTGEGLPPYGLAGPFISVETSRGCTQACSFCATPSAKGRFRSMTLPTIEKHLVYLQSQGVRNLLFQEDNLLSRIHRRTGGAYAYPEGRAQLFEILRMVREMGFTWEFTNGLELGRLEFAGKVDRELIDALLWHEQRGEEFYGCYRATLPLENLTERGEELFRKVRPFGVVTEVVAGIVSTGIHSLTFNVIIGRPDDTEADLVLTYQRCQALRELCSSLNPRVRLYFNIYTLSLLPGTTDFRRYESLLAYDLAEDPEVITFYLGSLQTPHFSPLEITQARGAMANALNSRQLIGEYDENHYLADDRFIDLFAEHSRR